MKNNIVKIILIVFVQMHVFFAFSNTQKFVFKQFPLNGKLPSNSVTRTFQDKDGYVWFGTKDGLCRFDGYDVKVFRSSAQTPGKLTNNEIESIVEDKYNKLWIGTYEGVNILDKKNFEVKPFKNEYTDNKRINYVMSDRSGFVWICVANVGLLKVNAADGKYEFFSSDKKSRIKLTNNNISQIFEDRTGNIWLTYWKGGIMCLEKETEKVLIEAPVGPNNNPFRIFQDSDGLYWILTWGDGIYHMTMDSRNQLNVFQPKLTPSSSSIDKIVYSIAQDDKFGHVWVVSFSGLYVFQKNGTDVYDLIDGRSIVKKSSGEIYHDIYKDTFGNLWLGSLADGAYRLDLMNLSFDNFPIYDLDNTVKPFVTNFSQTDAGNLYVALDRKGLFKFDLANGDVSNISNSQLNELKSISAIQYISNTDEIWIANEGTGLIYIFAENGNGLDFKRMFSVDNSNENLIKSFYEDDRKNVWIGANTGLYKKMADDKLETFSLPNINTIGQDTEGNIWAGTDKQGLYKLKRKLSNGGKATYEIEKIELKIKNHFSNGIQSIHCRKNGDVYIGTKEGCIYFFDKANNSITDISGQYGITDQKILDIVEDNQGNLWISTMKQIIRYNPVTKASTYYSSSNGMLISSFNKDAILKLKNGKLLFGGNNGICSFNPTALQKTEIQEEKRVLLTDIFIQNKSIFDLEQNNVYDPSKNRVRIKYKDNNIGIEFSAPDYRSANNIQYAYKLDGVNEDWNYVGNNKRFVNYADLPFGNYVFMVRASDENGLWGDDITTLSIHILPPLYRTWWAYLLYVLALFAFGVVLYRNFSNRIRLRNDLRISKIEKDKTEELTQTKLRFFTNITHELLTPMTIIMLEIEKLQGKLNDNPKQYSIIKDNVLRLRRLIEQILYFRKAESGNMKLQVSREDVVAFVDKICSRNFKSLYDNKGINFSFASNVEKHLAYFDKDKVDKIIYNLLSNAYKHTPSGGNVNVDVKIAQKNDHEYLSFTVEDTGTGIAEKDLPFIFDRFFITSTSDQSKNHGIGLALTKDLISLHKGDIRVKSIHSEGATFIFEIPVSKDAFREEEIVTNIEEETAVETEETESGEEQFYEEEEPRPVKEYTILVVEDNKDLREIIYDKLEKSYKVFVADNGINALELINAHEIDIVVSDVMMPVMDGLTLCRTIKKDINTSHISVLMLTAKDSPQDRIDCYEAGAEGYISKPFELAVLEARLKNLINSTNMKMKKFQQNHEVNISSMEYSSADEEYLKIAISKVEERLADEKYDFEQFAMDMSSSKSTLHRKLKSLTGLSPWEFIRNIRLKHAAQMLKNSVGNVSEISFKVGFNDPKYFSRCFKTEFGMTPKEFQDQHRES